MFTTAEDWLRRFEKLGCRGRYDSVTMLPGRRVGEAILPGCEVIWSEIRGSENETRWREVEALVRQGHRGFERDAFS